MEEFRPRPLTVEESIEVFKRFVRYGDFSKLRKVPIGSQCSCYLLPLSKRYHKTILKVSSNRNKEDSLLKRFSSLKSLPKLYWSDSSHSIVEYIYQDMYSGVFASTEDIKQLISDYYFIAANGYLLQDMSLNNILFNDEEGLKIIDLGSYNETDGFDVDKIFKRTESRFWSTIQSYARTDDIQEYKDYGLEILKHHMNLLLTNSNNINNSIKTSSLFSK